MRPSTEIKKIIRESPEVVRLRKKRRGQKIRLAVLFGILFFTCIFGAVYFFRYPKFQIRSVSVSGNLIIDSGEIETAVMSMLSGKYAFVIPKTNVFLYPKNNIHAKLLDMFPRIESLLISKNSSNQININIKEAHAVALWCGEKFKNITPDTDCYFTDMAGKIVALAPYYSGDIYVRFFGEVPIGATNTPLGKFVMNEELFAKLLKFSEEVRGLGLKVMDIAVVEKGECQFMIDIGGDKHAPIRFLLKDDFRVLNSNLTAAITKPELAKKYKAESANLQYFDLRFKNKVYYKFEEPVKK